jgi:DNA polymerase III subunit delta
MKANSNEITRAMNAPPPHIRLFLLYGPDEGGATALVKRLERSLGPDVERIELESPVLAADPARLSDEAMAFSLFGGKRYIRISPVADNCVPAIEALLEATTETCPVVALAGALKPSNALLKLALARPDVMVFASYAPKPAEAEAIAIALGREVGLRIPSDIARMIVSAAASERSIMAQEIEKIALFLGSGPARPMDVTRDAVRAVGASITDSALSTLAEAAIGGRGEATVVALAELKADGVNGVPMLRAMQKRVALIAELHAAVTETGQSPESVVESRGKAIFYQEKPGVLRDLKRWNAAQLATASLRLLAAERAVKSASNAGDVLAEAEIIRVMRAAARLR